MKALLDSGIWSDPAFEELPPEGKLIFLWLLTNPTRDNAGVTRVGLKRLSFETGIALADLDGYLELAMRAGKFEKHGDRVLSVNWIKRQIGTGESFVRNNIIKQISKLMESYPDSLKQSLLSHYPDLNQPPLNPLTRGSEGSRKGKESTGKERKGIKEAEQEVDDEAGSIHLDTTDQDGSPSRGVADQEAKRDLHTIESFLVEISALYGTNASKITPEAKRMVFNQCPTDQEMRSVIKFIKKHRAGKFGKNAPAISTTANRALVNIGDMIDRALASDQVRRQDREEIRVKPMPSIERDDPTPEEIQSAKKQIADLKNKIRKGQ